MALKDPAAPYDLLRGGLAMAYRWYL